MKQQMDGEELQTIEESLMGIESELGMIGFLLLGANLFLSLIAVTLILGL